LVRSERAEAENLSVIADEAGRIVDRANTVCSLANPRHEPSLGLPFLLKDDGTKQYLVSVLFPLPMEFGHSVKLKRLGGEVVSVVWTSQATEPSFDYERACARLAANPTAEIIKSFLGRPRDWGQVYNVVELIEGYYRGKIPATW
jgi:hypothetical protein